MRLFLCWIAYSKIGISIQIPDTSPTIFTASGGYVAAYGAKEPKTELIQVNRVEFDHSGMVYEFGVPAYILPAPCTSSQLEGAYYPGEPFVVVTKNHLAHKVDISPRENVARADAFKYDLKPEQVEVVRYPSENDVFLSIMPTRLQK